MAGKILFLGMFVRLFLEGDSIRIVKLNKKEHTHQYDMIGYHPIHRRHK
jgi:hypothetical protein